MTSERALEDRKGRAHNRELAGQANFHDINWAHYTHPQLYDMVHTADLHHIGDQASQWRKLANGIDETTTAVRHTLSNLFATWQGGAADTARAANDQLTRWADQMTRRTDKIADRLDDYHEALGAARQAMPPPEFAWAENAFNNGGSPKMMNGPSGEIEIQQFLDDQKPNFEKHHAAWQEAVRVMSNYGQQSQVAHDKLPEHYERAPQTTSQPGTPGDPDWPDGGGRPIPLPPPYPPPRPPDKPDGSGVPGDIDGDGIPDGTTPGGYNNPGGGGSGTGYGPGYGPGGIGGPGSGADAGRGAPGGGGMAGAGPLTARGGGPGAAAGLAGARGAAGAGAYPPFGAGGAGAQREEDEEHKDKYAEPTDFFDDLPPAYPPVFGA